MASREVIILLLIVLGTVMSQNACDPMDSGPIPPVPPTLYMRITEATQEDLAVAQGDYNYQSEIRLYGVLDPASPNAIRLEFSEDFRGADPSDYFVMKTDSTGQKNILRLSKPLDRDGPTADMIDDIDEITFTLRCTSLADTTKQKLYEVTIHIIDVNDNSPVFLATPSVWISELTQPNTYVTTLTAEDKDWNDGIKYRIVKQLDGINDGSSLFRIDEEDGKIYVGLNSRLDYEGLGEDTRYYTLAITATDRGNRTTRRIMRISILDAEEYGPVFEYEGCVRFDGYCVRPTYTASSVQILDKPITFYPVPNPSGRPVTITFRDRDPISLSLSSIEAFLVKTIPEGYQDHFEVRTRFYPHTVEIRQKSEIPREDMSGMELFIKLEEVNRSTTSASAMIIFENPDSKVTPEKGEETAEPKAEPEPEYTNLTLALIIVIAITLTLVICLAIVVMCLVMQRRHSQSEKKKLYSSKEGFVNEGSTSF